MRYTTPPLQQNAIEPHATIAVWQGDRLTLHDTTQNIQAMRTHIAWRFAVPPANVRVIAPFVGGGFGGKFAVWPGTVLTVLAARVVGRPVRMVLTRKGVSRTAGGRTASTNRIALGADRDGRLTAIVHTSVTRLGRTGGTLEQTTGPARHLYGAANLLAQQNVVELDLLPNSWLRAPGEAIGTFVLESAMDELAHELRMDPIALRMRNEPETDPINGRPFSQRMLRQAFTVGAERFGWSERTPEPRSIRDGRLARRHGRRHRLPRSAADDRKRHGASCSRRQRAGAVCDSTRWAWAAQPHRRRSPPTRSACPSRPSASSTATPTSRPDRWQGNPPRPPPSPPACWPPATRSSSKLRTLARRTGTVGRSHAETLAAAGGRPSKAAVGSDTWRGKVAGQAKFVSTFLRDQRWSKAARGAQFCEVRVDTDTGEVRISRWLGVFDVGRIINPKTAASQLRGCIVMGIGMALSEQTLVDPRNGRTMSAGLDSYYVPVHADIPTIDVAWLDEPDPTMPLGIVGLGEVGMTGVAAAIANAVFHATGKRIRDLPITLDKLM